MIPDPLPSREEMRRRAEDACAERRRVRRFELAKAAIQGILSQRLVGYADPVNGRADHANYVARCAWAWADVMLDTEDA